MHAHRHLQGEPTSTSRTPTPPAIFAVLFEEVGGRGKDGVLGAFGDGRVVKFTKSFREVGGRQIRALALVWGHKP